MQCFSQKKTLWLFIRKMSELFLFFSFEIPVSGFLSQTKSMNLTHILMNGFI